MINKKTTNKFIDGVIFKIWLAHTTLKPNPNLISVSFDIDRLPVQRRKQLFVGGEDFFIVRLLQRPIHVQLLHLRGVQVKGDGNLLTNNKI